MYNAFNYNSPYITPVPAVSPFAQSAKQEIIKVNGYEGANAYQMTVNSSALLLDINNPVVYLKQTDGAGYASITAYKIEPLKETMQITTNDLELRIKRLEDIINESYTFSAKPTEQQKSAQSD